MAKDLLILDCDGTLMDSIGAWHEAEEQLMDEAGLRLSKEERDELNALTLEEAGEFFHDRFGIRGSADEVVQAILDYMLDFYETKSQANPGALEFVMRMHQAEVPMCVLSSSPQSFLRAGLSRGGFMEFIPEIISVDDLQTTKRDVETYRVVCDRMGCSMSQAWLFDDSWYALATARQAGLRTVGVYSTDNCGTHDELGRYCDIVVDSFDELDVATWI